MSRPTKVVFVCWGNICRSPMGERVARRWFAEAGLSDVEITSAGVSSEELGNPIDPRAVQTLKDAGYTYAGHHAHRISAAEIADADLVLAFEPIHVERMRRMTPDIAHVRLMTDFIPGATSDSIDDPWYGGQEGFTETLRLIEAAMPGIIEYVRGLSRGE